MITRAAFQLQRRAIGQQAALGNHHRAGTQRRDLFEDMSGNDHDLVARQPLNKLAHLMLLVGVEAVGGLIEDQHARVMQDRLGQANAALEALGQRLDALLQHLLQLHLLHRALHALLLLGTAKATYLGDKFKKTTHRHVAVARRTLRQITDLPLGLEGLGLNIAAEDARRAGGRREKAGKHLHGGGFAGPVGAEKAQHFPWLDLERQVIDCRVLRKTLGQVSYIDHGLSPSRMACAQRNHRESAGRKNAGHEHKHAPGRGQDRSKTEKFSQQSETSGKWNMGSAIQRAQHRQATSVEHMGVDHGCLHI